MPRGKIMITENVPFLEVMKNACATIENFPQKMKDQKQHTMLLSLLLGYVNKHSKTFAVRYDLNFPSTILDEDAEVPQTSQEEKHHRKFLSPDDQERFSTPEKRKTLFQYNMQHSIENIKNKYKYCDPQYIYAIEKSSKNKYGHEHFHVLLLLDGNKVRHIKNLKDILENTWHKQIGIEKKQNAGLLQLFRIIYGETYDGTMLYRNSPDFICNFAELFKISSYLVKDKQKDDVPFRKKVNTSQLKSEKGLKEIKSFAHDLIQSCLKNNTESFYEKYIDDNQFRKILLWGSKSSNEEQTSCNLKDNSVETSDDSDGTGTSDNNTQAEQAICNFASQNVETTSSRLTLQSRDSKVNQTEVEFYDMFDSSSGCQKPTKYNLANNTDTSHSTGNLDVLDDDEIFKGSPFNTEVKEIIAINSSPAPQDVHIETKHENMNYQAKQEEIDHKDKNFDQDREYYEAIQQAKRQKFIPLKKFAEKLKAQNSNSL